MSRNTKLPFVVREKTRHGKIIYYFRKGKDDRTRLPIPSDPSFMPAYLSALSGIPIEQSSIKPVIKEPQTMRWLIEQYRKSGHWASLALKTRKRIDQDFSNIIKNSGDFEYKKITAKHIRLGLEHRKSTPASAVLFLSSIRLSYVGTNKNIE
ncbi:phage-related integrase/recombinase [Candidatus Liberibacter solanacearum CLso-ZC1]|uniref:Phage-related integrase/recombinase n=1 Tax=Liberibacter solanacearum (strain CLso-ZC1) TaxID=658172 RepID=E4UBB7_LIBSC|nr:hypothetical protein [Candidatus Liberibacter solanacearum]ADR52596.1 phage-related integrase/recombinase [Candidatus Liberibacter solanacearum CLso-ZC1]